MSELTIYGIPSCDTCRKARQWLVENDRAYRFHDLREDGLDMQMLERWAEALDWQTILNTRSLTWRKIPEIDRADMTKSRAFAFMLDQPTLIKRPLLEYGKLVTAGYSPAAFKQFSESIDSI